MSEPKRYRLTGELQAIVGNIVKEREAFNKSSKSIAKKHGFNSYFTVYKDFASGGKLAGFGDPAEGCDLSKYRKPTEEGCYIPRAKEGKQIKEEIKAAPFWSLKKVWDHLGYTPNIFSGNGGIYQDEKLNDEYMFYTFDEAFKGHKDLVELKKSEYYTLIGE